MGRIRTIKPELALDEELFEAEQETGLPVRFAFAALLCHCDREGRFEWKPRRLKLQILPYDDLDFSRVLDALATRGFLVRYACGTRGMVREYGVVRTFAKHQSVNNKEAESTLPSPEECGVDLDDPATWATREPRVSHASATRLRQDQGEGKGREGKGKEGKGESASDSSLSPDETSFIAWWALWPPGRKVGKEAAKKAYIDARRRISKAGMSPSAARDHLHERMTAFATSPKCKGDFCPNPSTWLNQGRYDDDPAAWRDNGADGPKPPELPEWN